MRLSVTDMETWMLDNDDRIYRFLVYKKLFTPYEQEMKFSDESQFEETQYRFGFIRDAIDLGSGKWMLGIQEVIDGEVCGMVSYFRLGDIQLSYFECDQNIVNDEDEDDEE